MAGTDAVRPAVPEVACAAAVIRGCAGAATTVTEAVADFDPSATLVAVTVTTVGAAGAVKTPPEVMLPALALQVTAPLLALATWAVKVREAFTVSVVVLGDTDTDTGGGVEVPPPPPPPQARRTPRAQAPRRRAAWYGTVRTVLEGME